MSSTVQHGQLLTVEETAERLRVSEKTVRRFVGAGILPALKIGAQVRIDRTELEAWIYSSNESDALPPLDASVDPAGARRGTTANASSGQAPAQRAGER